MENKQYVGPLLVEMVSETEHKTHGGKDIVEVVYASGKRELMPKLSFELLVTESPSDYTDLQNRKMKQLVLELLGVIAEYDFKASDIEALKSDLEMELYNSFNRATHYLWTKDDESFVPGSNVVLDRSLIEADIVIKGIKNEPGENKSSE